MNKLALVLLACLLGSEGAAANTEVKYDGSLGCFKKFNDVYQLNWPTPEEIGYFNKGLVDKTSNDQCGSPSGTAKAITGIRYAHWVPVPNENQPRGVVVHFNGRTEFIERNIYTYQELIKRGYEVWAFDWRGQGFSVRQKKKTGLLKKQMHYISTFDTYVKDAEQLIDQVIQLGSRDKYRDIPKILLAHSMGGQIGLRYLLKNQIIFDKAVMTSPLLRLPMDDYQRIFVTKGNEIKYRNREETSCVGAFDIWGVEVVEGKKDHWESNFKVNQTGRHSYACDLAKKPQDISENYFVNLKETEKYTGDLHKNAQIDCLVESSIDSKGQDQPDLRLACPTTGWLRAAFKSTDTVMEHYGDLKTPLLIVRALPDTAVDNAGQDQFIYKFPPPQSVSVKMVSIGGSSTEQGTRYRVPSGHEILIEKENIRVLFFEEFDRFVNQH